MIKPDGTLEIDYHIGRKTKRSLKYRLQRRTREVIRAIETYHLNRITSILDIGTADGLMLSRIRKEFPQARCIGLEYSESLIAINEDETIEMVCADAQNLPFKDECFDIAIATAVIEHVPNPNKMLEEAYRVLIRGGILILTTPEPFWEHVATMVGHLSGEQHSKVMNLRELQEYLSKVQFEILEADKFMLSPVGMPLEFKIERVVKSLGLRFLFANQIAVGRK